MQATNPICVFFFMFVIQKQIMNVLGFNVNLLHIGKKSNTLSPSLSYHQPSSTSTRLRISNLLNNSSSSPQQPQLPKDVKDAVSKCKASVQVGLEKRISRMNVEFPVGTKFGVEKANGGSKKKFGGKLLSALDGEHSDEAGVTKDVLDKSDRELARLFIEMFQPLGGDHIACVFSDEFLADIAKNEWKGDLGAECQIMSIGRGKRKKSLMKGMGKKGMGGKKNKVKKTSFAAKMKDELSGDNSGPFKLPENCDVAFFVAPTVKDLITINGICDEIGMGTLVILLNARLSLIENLGSDKTKQFFEDKFEDLFYLSMAPQNAAPGCLLHKAFPSDWIIARKPKVGNPKTIATFLNRPTDDECREAFDGIEVGGIEKNVENALENFATWVK